MQLLTAALPSLERLQKDEGEAGRRKISQFTRYVALGWAIIQSIGFAIFVNSAPNVAQSPGPWFIAQMVLALTAGSM
ncbi:MAG: preprotein translocase subunit SecY, partial [Thermosynechococcaceae cyanobacterium]